MSQVLRMRRRPGFGPWGAWFLAWVIEAVLLQASAVADTTAPEGQLLFAKYCAACHGTDGNGPAADAATFVTPPRNLRAGFAAQYSRDELIRRVRDGKPLNVVLDSRALQGRAREIEAVYAYLEGLPRTDWPLVFLGRDLFLDRCAACHGAFGRPGTVLPAGVRAPRDLSAPAVQRSVTDRELLILVRHGREHMPALVPRVSEGEARALVAYVRMLSPGFELYDRYCASCHGETGRGVGTLGETMRLPTVVFDGAYFKTHDPELIRGRVWHMAAEQSPSMPHYRSSLSEAEAAAIVEFLQHGS